MSDLALPVREKTILASPDYVRTSLAASITLGFQAGLFHRKAVLRGLNLLTTYQHPCAANCSYCGLAGSRKLNSRQATFIRVAWPVYSLDEMLEAVRTRKHRLQRVCVGMITRSEAVRDAIHIIRRFKEETDLLISALVSPTVLREGDLQRIREAGADMCGIAVDCATEELFEEHRGKKAGGPHRWTVYWDKVQEAVHVFGRQKAGIHLVVGLGETEEEMIKLIQRAYDLGALTHLFSFYPEAGSALESRPQPCLGHYRRVQLARYIINQNLGRAEEMSFTQVGQLTDFGQEIAGFLADGRAFLTSGCAGKDGEVACNRPYGNERPSQPIRNFPFRPAEEDLLAIREQLWQGLVP